MAEYGGKEQVELEPILMGILKPEWAVVPQVSISQKERSNIGECNHHKRDVTEEEVLCNNIPEMSLAATNRAVKVPE